MTMMSGCAKACLTIAISMLSLTVCFAQVPSDTVTVPSQRAAIILNKDTLLYVYGQLGPFSPQQRATAINGHLSDILKNELDPSLIRVTDKQGYSQIELGELSIMAVTDEDATRVGKPREAVSEEYARILRTALIETQQQYSVENILKNGGITLLILAVALGLLWAIRKIFPRLYEKCEQWEGSVFRPLRIRSYELVSAAAISSFFIILLKVIRLGITLLVLYYVITYSLSLFPWTKAWNIKPILIGILLTILTTAVGAGFLKGINTFFRALIRKIEGWKGTLIRPLKLKTVEVLSVDRIAEMLEGSFKLLKLFALAVLGYFYITLVFSYFTFTRTWAKTLIGYIIDPLWNVVIAFVEYLPNLFFILVIVYVTRYAIKFVKFLFDEIGKGTFTLPGFYNEWAEPTYKIVRFLILAFAAIVIFPYLPGSSSPVFQGISVFLGVLFSLGSTSAIANIVAGVVLTYMRPFSTGDRVKIADTTGDIVERNLLVTRVRTIKNVDVTIPNAMVLGSHIINFSSSAQDRGLVLHTGVTIGYDVPWKKVHELLIASAEATGGILKEPRPFVFQTSLDDFYVSYELNAYTDKPNIMAKTYSELHQNIQDKFNEAGVEIMSPHYSAMRDGNMTTIPENYLPQSYSAPAFRLFPMGNFMGKSGPGGNPPDDSR